METIIVGCMGGAANEEDYLSIFVAAFRFAYTSELTAMILRPSNDNTPKSKFKRFE